MDIRRLKDGYDVLDKLYDDNDLNCDNFAQAVRGVPLQPRGHHSGGKPLSAAADYA